MCLINFDWIYSPHVRINCQKWPFQAQTGESTCIEGGGGIGVGCVVLLRFNARPILLVEQSPALPLPPKYLFSFGQ